MPRPSIASSQLAIAVALGVMHFIALPTHAQEITAAAVCHAVDAQVQLACNPILAHPGVSAADKEKVRALLKAEQEATKKILAEVGEKGDPVGVAAKGAHLMEDLQKFLLSRGDLYWISIHGTAVRTTETSLLLGQPDEYLAVLKTAGVPEARIAEAKKTADALQSDQAKQKDTIAHLADETAKIKAVQEYQSSSLAQTAAARQAIRTTLTGDQSADLDWALLRHQYSGDADNPALRIIAFSAQAQSLKAPADGTYNLLLAPADPDSDDEPKPLQSVELKKGQSIGFRKTGDKLQAIAGEKQFDLSPASPLSCWQFAKK